MSENVCFSGGAIGADTAFGKIAKQHNHKVLHFVFQGKYGTGPDRVVLSEMQLLEADPYLREANQILCRGNFDNYFVYTKNLLRRNYYQIKETERVYAVAYLDEARLVEGGTGWAVTMAIQKGIKEIYLYNQYTRRWNQWIAAPHLDKYYWQQMRGLPPKPHGLYTGIGSSKRFTHDGQRAVEELYNSR